MTAPSYETAMGQLDPLGKLFSTSLRLGRKGNTMSCTLGVVHPHCTQENNSGAHRDGA